MRLTFLPLVLLLASAAPLAAETVTLAPVGLTDWKAVFGKVEARDRLPARARLGGTLVDLTVTEGDEVAAGQVIGRIVDDKISFQLSAFEAQKASLRAQLDNARSELKRGEELKARGVATSQQLDQLATQVSVLEGQIEAVEAQRKVTEQQAAEGAVLAPSAGRVLEVPVARGAVVQMGETVASIGGGGYYLRIAVPERHAAMMDAGDTILIDGTTGPAEGRIERVYPLIENGRVVADVTVEGLSDRFEDARVLVRLPMVRRSALVVPASALVTRSGVDFVVVEGPGGLSLRAVVAGHPQPLDGVQVVEILSGLIAGDKVRTDGAAAAAEAGSEPSHG